MVMEGGEVSAETPRQPTEGERKLAEEMQTRIRADKAFHKKAFDQMREDQAIARRGAKEAWIDAGSYVANITGRHIQQLVSALYAKNPKAIARRRERLDFAIWDETMPPLMEAMQIAMKAMQAPRDPTTGLTPALFDPQAQSAVALVQDYQAGMQAREQIERIGKTLELVFDYFTKEQTPVDFKTSMKKVVRRAATSGVGYVKLGFQREYDQDPEISDRLADFTRQMQHIDRLLEETRGSEERGDAEARREELRLAMASLQEQQFVLLREGLVFDFPASTRVIPDKLCRSLVGFEGARHVTVEYLYTVDEVKEVFGVDLSAAKYRKHSPDGSTVDSYQTEMDLGDGKSGKDLVCIWEFFDKPSGNVYYLADGYEGYLRPPAAPDVYVEDFWPVYALVFNEDEDEDEKALFPVSDVTAIRDMQMDYNRARQGRREHRKFARPRMVSRTGLLDDVSKAALGRAEPFSVTELDFDGDDIRKVLQPVAVPGVDPNLYETGETMQDLQLVSGSQEAQFGAVSKATATESAIADGSRMSSVESKVDDLDAFLTRLAKAGGQILLQEMSEESVRDIAGPGAVWPKMTLDQVVKEVYLEIEAGSSGKPNQAAEVKKWREMLPFLVQMPGISPEWLARESLRRLDDRMDLTDALTEGLPSIVQMNAARQPSPADPANAPNQQGAEGGNQTPRGQQAPEGTDAPMGNNQV
mgnify:FL=1